MGSNKNGAALRFTRKVVSPVMRALLLGAAATFAFAPAALANQQWTGAVDSDWFKPGNWTNGAPSAGDYTTIGLAPSEVVISGGAAATGSLTVRAMPGLTVAGGGALLTDVLNLSEGALRIGVGGGVTSILSVIGTSSTGTVAVTVDGGAWDSGALAVGRMGVGRLAIVNGGTVDAATMNTDSGWLVSNTFKLVGSSNIDVEGAGSRLRVAGHMELGDYGESQLTISNGGLVEAMSAELGARALLVNGQVPLRGSATATVDAGVWRIANGLTLGGRGGGELRVVNGGDVSSGSLTLAGALSAGMEPSEGVVLLSGAGSRLTTGMLTAGAAGIGTIRVEDGAQLQSASANLGNAATGRGEVVVDGATWNAGGILRVGVGGAGDLTIANGGVVTSGVSMLGVNAGARGSARVEYAGSQWTADVLLVGGAGGGEGYLTIGDGGRVSNIFANVGSDGIGEVNVEGGVWEVSADIFMADLGEARLAVRDGGAVSARGLSIADVIVGGGSPRVGRGEVEVTGAGSSLALTLLRLADWGEGALTIADGALVTADSAHVASQSVVLNGDMIFSRADVLVDGAEWRIANRLELAGGGHAQMLLSGGGAVTADAMVMAAGATGVADVRVEDAGSRLQARLLTLGQSGGTASLTLTDGGRAGATATTVNAASSITVGGGGFDTGSLVLGGGDISITNGGAFNAVTASVAGGGSILVSGESSWLRVDSLTNVSGDIRVARGGTFSTTMATLNSGGRLIIGGESAADAPGAIGGASVTLADVDTALVINHTGEASIASSILGAGTLDHRAGVTRLTGDSSLFGGEIRLSGGALYINGVISADATATGGRLGGSGTIFGDVALGAGGTLAPGNSIGVLTVGDVSFGPNSILEIEVNAAGASDLIRAGDVTISGGTVRVLAENGRYREATGYRVIEANSVSGGFTDVTSNLAFLDAGLTYGPQGVSLTLTRNDLIFSAAAQTLNQAAAARAFEALPVNHALRDALIGASAQQARAAFDSASGEFHASFLGGGYAALLESVDVLQERLGARAARGGADYWARASGGWGGRAGDGNAANFDYDRSGVLFGADFNVDGFRLGAALGHGRTHSEQSERASRGAAEGLDVLLYGAAPLGPFALSAQLGASERAIVTTRVFAVGGLTETLRADYEAQSRLAHVRLAYPIALARGAIEPFAGVTYVTVEADAFAESGGQGALRVENNREEVVFTTLGLRGVVDTARGGRAYGSLGWRSASGDLAPTIAAAFASDPATRFSVQGAAFAEHAAVAEAGLVVPIGERGSLEAGYRGHMGEDVHDHGVMVRFTWRQ